MSGDFEMDMMQVGVWCLVSLVDSDEMNTF